ncbi:ATP-dependent sacrificial sulfur transferase LarE [Desulfofundulus sp. TPOSR]|uniref:ATP-dependent sacrificial sulfur transferase LarE n=1 Tax=Desulfofundulus sp. TPOSR TaxID=2714340 RepID=UPI0014094CBD|nr:ATP-dependent sacrificial sulfur transferase LarE [Desulfofundulus sp. TPOSR]NHM26144.1 ATP-dependent sacrificial sulfur transferase LarE [Desulfofundulus sp. TPOSR]
MSLLNKFDHLKKILENLDGCLVAFSGGVDSTLLLKVARMVLGEKRVLAVTATSDIYPPEEVEEATALARLIGARHLVMETAGSGNPVFATNPPDRCYHCKKEIYARLWEEARIHGLNCVLDGLNADDTGDYRPGIKAAKEMGVRSPLQEAGLTKGEIRALSRQLGLPTAGKPASPCLATRFPYGTPVTREGLVRVAEGERFLRQLGISELRVRDHGNLARLEVPKDYLAFIIQRSKEISERLKQLGYTYVTLDIQGFRSGSMNETLSLWS